MLESTFYFKEICLYIYREMFFKYFGDSIAKIFFCYFYIATIKLYICNKLFLVIEKNVKITIVFHLCCSTFYAVKTVPSSICCFMSYCILSCAVSCKLYAWILFNVPFKNLHLLSYMTLTYNAILQINHHVFFYKNWVYSTHYAHKNNEEKYFCNLFTMHFNKHVYLSNYNVNFLSFIN